MSTPPDTVAALASGAVEIVGRMPNSSNATFLVTVGDPHSGLRGIYKPLRGERPLWDFDPGLYKHEVAAYRVSESLGWDLVPPTVVADGPYGEGSLQLFVEFDPSEHYFTILDGRPDLHDTLKRMAVFDVVVNNTDRKGGHVLLSLDGHVRGIDHGVCFSPDFKLRTVIWDFGGQDIDPALLESIAPWLDEVPTAVSAMLTDDEVDAMRERIEWLVDSGSFPVATSRYEYPWPLL